MIEKFRFFSPIGPLSYLLMTKKGKRKLGLYKCLLNNSLVMIFPVSGKEYVLYPTIEKLTELMQNKITISDILHSADRLNLTDIRGNRPGLYQLIKVHNYIEKELGGKLTEIASAVLYPNHYYLFNEYCIFEAEEKAKK